MCVAVESWSWIASVFTRPLNKAFLSVFLVFGIWDFGMVVVFFFFSSLCIPPPPPPPQVNFWFKRILPAPLPSDPQLFEIIMIVILKENVSAVLLFIFFFLLSLPPFLCHIVKVFFCHFWFMHFDIHLCRLLRLFVRQSLVCFPSETKSGEVSCRHHTVLTKKVPRWLLSISLDR